MRIQEAAELRQKLEQQHAHYREERRVSILSFHGLALRKTTELTQD